MATKVFGNLSLNALFAVDLKPFMDSGSMIWSFMRHSSELKTADDRQMINDCVIV